MTELAPKSIEQLAASHAGITADSRRVAGGWLFVALPPSFSGGQDGRDYIGAAIENGATAILTDDGAVAKKISGDKNIAIITSDNPRRDLSLLLSARAGAMPRNIALVTGTNGKSSIVQMARELWARGNLSAASIGTLGIVREGAAAKSTTTLSHTTPDPEWLYPALAALHRDKVDHVAMEASSHGLHQYRLDGIIGQVVAGAMAELSQDHLDYHQTLDHYYQSKLRLFTDILSIGGRAIFWQHCAVAEKISAICDQRQLTKIMMSRKKNSAATLFLSRVTPTDNAGQVMDFQFMGKNYQARIPLTGHFQAENALTALMMVMKDNSAGELQKYLPHLATLSPIRGRIEKIAEHRGAHFFVDYAHTDAALATALQTLRPFTKRNLIVVFGCGGNRDATKRPKMGRVANELADKIIVTDDNPRGEVASKIRAAILAACENGIEAENRRQAIAMAVAMADKGDVVLVAGKGHETGQIIGDKTLPFDDAEVIREEIKNDRK
ncbi:MAG: UDP-N-acetylmuramoyl-L-alanyl-D-glutamate--2,6-diaminopimelate ligase [Hydrotalea sp.]|nr:UDP-N-acetylmuramoyl-L-alanyl-D-glutamate--2,6-diaminopimelate ligase [Hydrotalea sp.]